MATAKTASKTTSINFLPRGSSCGDEVWFSWPAILKVSDCCEERRKEKRSHYRTNVIENCTTLLVNHLSEIFVHIISLPNPIGLYLQKSFAWFLYKQQQQQQQQPLFTLKYYKYKYKDVTRKRLGAEAPSLSAGLKLLRPFTWRESNPLRRVTVLEGSIDSPRLHV